MADELRKHGGELTEDMVESLIESMIIQKASVDVGVRVKLSYDIRKKYFTGMIAIQVAEVVEQALKAGGCLCSAVKI